MTARAWTLGILGYPLGYSLSPLMHQAAFRVLAPQGVQGTYREFPVPPEALEMWLTEQVPALGLDGFNVTIPHKEAIFAWLKRRGGGFKYPEEEWIGAINTVTIDGNRWEGRNTDAQGFLDVFHRPEVRDRLGARFRLAQERVVLLGAGGSARAVAFALVWHAKVAELVIWNRHRARAEALAANVTQLCREGAGRACTVRVVDEPSAAGLEEAQLLVNTVPVSDELLMDPERLGPGLVVYDLVYHPPWTALLRAAKRRGATVISGLEMLASQAALAFHVWLSDVAPHVRPVMVEALHQQVGDQWPS